ncbi:hypothetical protein GCM10008997_01330 [Halomonas salifodinae]
MGQVPIHGASCFINNGDFVAIVRNPDSHNTSDHPTYCGSSAVPSDIARRAILAGTQGRLAAPIAEA